MQKKCDTCGNLFTPKRADAQTCSPACRTRKHRLKQRPDDYTPPPRIPLPEEAARHTWELNKTTRKLAGLLADDRWKRNRTRIADAQLPLLLEARARLDRVIGALQGGAPSSDTET